MKSKLLTLPKTPDHIQIDPAWIAESLSLRDKSVETVSVDDDSIFINAGELIQLMTRKTNEMEVIRKSITKPFYDAQRLAKKLADDATQPLRDECDRLKKLSAAYIREQERLRRQEQAEIERAQREEAERQIAEHEKAVAVGLEDADSQPDIQLPEPPAETLTAPKSYDVSVRKDLVGTVYDEDAVTREFCSPDQAKIRAYLKEFKAPITETCEDNDGVYMALPGIRITLETKVQSR